MRGKVARLVLILGLATTALLVMLVVCAVVSGTSHRSG